MKPEGMLNECVSMCWPTVVMCLCTGERERQHVREASMCDFVLVYICESVCVCVCGKGERSEHHLNITSKENNEFHF